MRLLSIGAVFVLALIPVSGPFAQQSAPADLTGSWTFVWQNDSKNSNPATLKHETGTLTGTYINDAKEKCPVAGRLGSAGTQVFLTITCPRWEIKCDGSLKGPKTIVGRYVAYGTATGDFQMSRQ
jgi:hypothetical protein